MNLEYYTPDRTKDIWILSDYHGFHKNICVGSTSWPDKSRCRNFSNEIEMTHYVVNQTNSLVKPDDILYCLGDWSFGGKDKIKTLREMIKCQNIILILGNHDKNIVKNKDLHTLFTHISRYEELRISKLLISMHHYPIGSWNEIGNGGIMLHGHSHHSYKSQGRILDVGIDGPWDYKPLNLREVVNDMKNKDIYLVDHHNESTTY